MDTLGHELADRQLAGTISLPNLERVLMSASPNLNWLKLVNKSATTMRAETGKQSHSISLALLDYPNVRHFRQSDFLGPLALDPELIKVSQPPTIITHHMHAHRSVSFENSPPAIVLGTLNRYIFAPSQLSLFPPGNAMTQGNYEQVLAALMPMFQRAEVVVKGPLVNQYPQGQSQQRHDRWDQSRALRLLPVLRPNRQGGSRLSAQTHRRSQEGIHS